MTKDPKKAEKLLDSFVSSIDEALRAGTKTYDFVKSEIWLGRKDSNNK